MPRAGLDSESVVDAAAQISDAEGLESLTLAALAAQLGVRAPSLYSHVASLADVRRRLGERGARELAAVMGRAAAGRAGGDALHAVADAYRTYASAHPGTYAAAQRARELQQSDTGAAAGAAAVEVALAVVRGYGLEGDDAIHAARIIRSSLHGFALIEAGDGFAIDLSPDESFERLVEVLDRGLRGSGHDRRAVGGAQA